MSTANTESPLASKEQGVTSATLQLTLPGPHSVRARVRRACQGVVVANRTHCVSTRLNPAELIILQSDARAAHKRCGQMLRDAYFNGSIKHVPAINIQAWERLGESLDDLHEFALKMNARQLSEGLRPLLVSAIAMLQTVRDGLIGGDDEG